MEIDLSAISANLAEIRRRAGAERKVIAVLKADGYGHGCAAVASHLEGCGIDMLAVGSLDDAASIRAAGVRAPTLLLSPLLPEMIGDVLALDLIPTVETRGTAEALIQAAEEPAEICVKVDCGFGRHGIPIASAFDLVRDIVEISGLRVAGIFTHLPFSDRAGRDWAQGRVRAFRALIHELARAGIRPSVTQALSSSGLLAGFDDCGWIAAGSLLFGLAPVGPELLEGFAGSSFRPALAAIRTKLTHVGARPPGEEAAPYLRQIAGRLGVIPIGIHQAYRPTSCEAMALLEGVATPILRPCLESTIIDLSDLPGAAVGADVLVLGSAGGRTIGIDQLAAWQGTNPLSLATALGRGIARRYVNCPAAWSAPR
jgi:alanine racemase